MTTTTDKAESKPFLQTYFNAIAMIMGLIVVCALGWQFYKLEKISSSLATQSVGFKNEDEFNDAVANAFNKFVENKKRALAQEKLQKYTNAPATTANGKHIYGSSDARFTLVEFSDLECPYCKRFHDTPKQLVDASKGNVNWQWMHLPLGFHNPAAKDQAIASECVAEELGNRAFWAFLSDIFTLSRGNGQGVNNIVEVATDLGADKTKFLECMSSGRYENKIADHLQKAQSQGISGTPATVVVDNQTGKIQIVPGAQPPQAIMAVVGKLKAEAEEAAETPDGSTEPTATPILNPQG